MSPLLVLCLLCQSLLLRGERRTRDAGPAAKVGVSASGCESVDLRCDADHFSVNVTLSADFEGVVYARGSFARKKPPCFKRRDRSSPRRDRKLVIGLRIPFDECGTLMDVAESRYTNTLVVQQDPDLVMPGDAAFTLDCAFVPEFKVGADVRHAPPGTTPPPELPFRSKITLVDADPAEETSVRRESNATASSKTERVSFVSNATPIRDEL